MMTRCLSDPLFRLGMAKFALGLCGAVYLWATWPKRRR